MLKLSKESAKAPEGSNKGDAEKKTDRYKDELFYLQNVFYAARKYSLLIILQGLDASGKDSTIRHVFSSLNPMGVNIKAFKVPTEEELEHDFLWRVHPHAPAKGMIEIFNRSHYEDVLVPMIQHSLGPKELARRFESILDFERLLSNNQTIILKFFLHVSRKEQAKRIKERMKDPHKMWKYDKSDSKEMENRGVFLKAYEKVMKETSKEIPWTIIPADDKWYRNYVIAQKVWQEIKDLKLRYPS